MTCPLPRKNVSNESGSVGQICKHQLTSRLQDFKCKVLLKCFLLNITLRDQPKKCEKNADPPPPRLTVA